jgi:hypothetical protein
LHAIITNAQAVEYIREKLNRENAKQEEIILAEEHREEKQYVLKSPTDNITKFLSIKWHFLRIA